MPIKPKLSICIDNCSTLSIYDNTLTESDSNPTGWGEDNIITPADLLTATLRITLPDLTVETITLDVTTLPNTVTTSFLLSSISISLDGEYTILYTVTYTDPDDPTATITVTNCIKIFNTCSVKCCVDKLWLAIYDDCSCDNTKYQKAMEAAALYKAIQNCAASKADTRNTLLAKLERICKFEKCNCK